MSLYGKEESKSLIGHCKSLFEIANKAHPSARLKKFEDYYRGRFESTKTTDGENANLANNFNIIKPIVETKVTSVLDSQISVSVRPHVFDFADLDKIKDISAMADIMDASLKNAQKENNWEQFNKKILRRTAKAGIGLSKIVWNAELANGIGDVEVTEINPNNFYPDPEAGNSIQACNYIFLKEKEAVLTLKKRYPEFAEKIEEMAKTSPNSDSDETEGSASNENSGRVITATSSGGTTQIFAGAMDKFPSSLKKNLDVFECYFKDDTVFLPESDDSDEEANMKAGNMKYPNGRVIIYIGDSLVLEDKPIDYDFGYPIEHMNIIETEDIWGQGEVEDLIEIQDRLNRAYLRLRFLIAKYVSIVLVDPTSGITNDSDLINAFLVMTEPGALVPGRKPEILTNNTLSAISTVLDYIKELKTNAKEISRVNDVMLSGERPTGVNSGEMISALTESPMTGIRDIQRSYKQFLINVCNKMILLIGKYYNVDRMVRLSEGKRFAVLSPRIKGELPSTSIYEADDSGVVKLVETIKGDLSICKFEVDVTAGSEMPRSRMATAQLTMQLVKDGVLDVNSPMPMSTKKIILEAMDYPNWRTITKQMEEEIAKQEQSPPPTPGSLIEKISLGFKDLEMYPGAQEYILAQQGVPQEAIAKLPMPPATPLEEGALQPALPAQ